ncbi:hypothetical protein [Dokdonella soli]|uniref:hypothetical protein n=1 Tax=Dokdonella soli TaxID=529810 RepID=UPI0031D9377C
MANIEKQLLAVFPQRVVDGPIAPHDCDECRSLRDNLAGITWVDVPSEFVNSNDDVLPLLSHDAYLAFLPAWLRQGVRDPGGNLANMLLVNLGHHPNTTGFTRRQAALVIEVAAFIAQSNVFGLTDPVNVESMAEIARVWKGVGKSAA